MNTSRKVGNLMLVEVNKQIEVGDLVKCIKTPEDTSFPEDYIVDSIKLNKNFNVRREQGYYIPIQPIVICDDEINYNDLVYNIVDRNIVMVEKDARHICKTDKKIFVLPNQFSPKFIEAIIYGLVKDGDKVEVEMEEVEDKGDPVDVEDATWARIYKIKQLKLRIDGTAIIHPYKESVEEAARKAAGLKEGFDREEEKYYNSVAIEIYDTFIKAAKWAAENNYKI